MNPTTLLQHASSAEPDRSVGAVVRDLLTTPAPTLAQVGILAGFLLAVLGIVVTIEMVRRRREQVSRNRSRWDNFTSMARQRGLDDAAIDRMREMHLGLDSLHAPDAMLRIPAVYDRALDAWIGARGGELAASDWQILEAIRRQLGFKGLSAETSLSHTRQIADGQDVRLAEEEGPWNGSGVIRTNREDRMVISVSGDFPGKGGTRLRISFSRQGDGEYKASTSILAIDHVGKEIQCSHTDQLLRQQLRMWVRVPVLIPGRMSQIIGPTGIPYAVPEFAVTLLDLSGGERWSVPPKSWTWNPGDFWRFPWEKPSWKGYTSSCCVPGRLRGRADTSATCASRTSKSRPRRGSCASSSRGNAPAGSTLDGCPPTS